MYLIHILKYIFIYKYNVKFKYNIHRLFTNKKKKKLEKINKIIQNNEHSGVGFIEQLCEKRKIVN